MSKHKLNLIKFLEKRIVYKDGNFNLISLASPNFRSGKYYIKSKTDFDAFLKLYIECLNNNIKPTFLEPTFDINKLFDFDDSFKHNNIIKIDLDFRYKYDNSLEESELLKHKYTNGHIKKIINLFINILKNYVDLLSEVTFVNENNNILEALEFYVLERDQAYISYKKTTDTELKDIKDGIHIICPHFAISIPILHKIRNELLEHDDFKSIINSIEQLNTIDNVLDKSVISTTPWFLYGSGKAMSDSYTLKSVYKYKKINDDIFTEDIKMKKLKDEPMISLLNDKSKLVFNLSNFGIKQIVPLINDTILNEVQSELNINLSSYNDDKKKYNEVLGINNEIDYSNLEIKKPENNSIPLKFIQDVLSCLKDSRASNYDDWWKIGQALYNIHWRNGYFLFKEFSKRCIAKYNESDVNDKWYQFEKNYMTNKYQFNIKYLKDLAFLDNKQKYNDISAIKKILILNGIIDIFRQPIYEKKIGDSTFSKEIKKIIDNDNSMTFIAVENNQWYYFDNHRWILDTEGNRIKMYIKDNVLSIFKKYYNNCADKDKSIQEEVSSFKLIQQQTKNDESNIQDVHDLFSQDSTQNITNVDMLENKRQKTTDMIIEQTILKERMNVAKRLIIYLEESAKRNIIVKELANEFYDANFYKCLDTNQNVFHCNNGIFDLNTCTFRDGVPDDRITIQSKNTYISDEIRYTDSDYIQYDAEYNEFFDKLFPNTELKEYMLNLWALSLSGKTFLQTFNVCTGTGSNGKSFNFELLNEVFGDYFCTTSPALLTKGRNDANSASPAVAVLIGKRIVVAEEPDENESIKTGVMKEAVSGSPITCRELHKPQKTFIPQYMLFFNCNDKPDITSTDEGTWRRIRVCPYVSKFCDSYDPRLRSPSKYKHFFLKDDGLRGKFTKWKEVFLNELIKRYCILKENKFKIGLPKLVEEAINDYKTGHNVFEGFKKDSLIKTAGDRLTVEDAFNAFKEYADQCNHKIKNINRNVFQTEMKRVLGPLKGHDKYWKDWTIVDKLDNDEEDETNYSDSENEQEIELENEETTEHQNSIITTNDDMLTAIEDFNEE
jgi:P4 family phage/plasmid primase-like protien